MQTAVQPKLSIILPVYNAGVFLHKCIQSLLNQTLKDIEIIIVLDCPTDGSDKIAKQYAAQDSRIKLIENKENLRVGESRNRGIDVASGEYIGFCDHDDYAEPDMYEKLYQAAKHNNDDITTCDVNCINTSGEYVKTVKLPTGIGEELKSTMLSAVLKINPHFGKTVWNVLFKREFLNAHALRFGDNRLLTSDDCLLLSKAYFSTNHTSHCDSKQGLYNHVGNPGSTLYQYSFLNVNLVLNYIDDLNKFISNHVNATDKQKYQYDLAHGTIRHLYTGLRREIKFKGLKYTWNMLKKAKENIVVQQNISPLFTYTGFKYAIKQIPPTKLVLLSLLHI